MDPSDNEQSRAGPSGQDNNAAEAAADADQIKVELEDEQAELDQPEKKDEEKAVPPEESECGDSAQASHHTQNTGKTCDERLIEALRKLAAPGELDGITLDFPGLPAGQAATATLAPRPARIPPGFENFTPQPFPPGWIESIEAGRYSDPASYASSDRPGTSAALGSMMSAGEGSASDGPTDYTAPQKPLPEENTAAPPPVEPPRPQEIPVLEFSPFFANYEYLDHGDEPDELLGDEDEDFYENPLPPENGSGENMADLLPPPPEYDATEIHQFFEDYVAEDGQGY